MNSYYKSIIAVKLIAVLIVGGGCTENKNKSETISADSANTQQTSEKQGTTTSSIALTYDKKFDQIASVIAGIKQQPGSEYSYIDTTAAWKSFSKSFDSVWAAIDKKRFSKMREWAKTEHAEQYNSTTDVFYPFSGPDILNAHILFPNAKTYTLLALEPIGELPDIKSMNALQRQNYYNSVEKSLNDVFKKSYFITMKMISDLQKYNVNGTVPLMCLFLKRTGNTITNIRYVAIDSTGKITEEAASQKDSKSVKGVRIDFISAPGSTDVRSVYYFKVDLMDGPLRSNVAMTNYLKNMGTVYTYLKSASYLLHYKEFSTVRNIIFEKSDMILQDDSGIAYRFFDQKKFKIQLYGRYADPVADFPHIKEPDLRKAYESDSSKVKELPFELGYHWGTKQHNMLKAVKIKP
ncbi:MAG: hypothetical protein NZ529_00080 [Cytophagaceae bacterium]|nr:hypothetical protein [Cytophagaceae bacterium]MDW8455163.1 hypothetical protein [Cytophagaceae bacterium]